jgi:hypothetical protein
LSQGHDATEADADPLAGLAAAAGLTGRARARGRAMARDPATAAILEKWRLPCRLLAEEIGFI